MSDLHDAAARGDLDRVRRLLAAGANPNAERTSEYGCTYTVLAQALQAGDPDTVEALLDAGADLHYERDGYDALIDAVSARDLRRDVRLLALLKLLLTRGVRLDTVTRYGESGLRILSRMGRFDAVAALLEAGADEAQLAWTPLIRATALGRIMDMRAMIEAGANLETRDFWERSAWLVALVSGDVAKAELLRASGADVHACGRCGQPPLSYAVASREVRCLRYALAAGCRVDATSQFGATALMDAAEWGDLAAVEVLLAAGAKVDFERVWQSESDGDMPAEVVERLREAHGDTALRHATDADVVRKLLAMGADPQNLSHEGRRALVGLRGEMDERHLAVVTPDEFERDRSRRYGRTNPERIDAPFWQAMIRSGSWAWTARQRFAQTDRYGGEPVWCAMRWGQSLTFLPDGRIVQVGGEHEDSYDPDFCIYNDVFVHTPDGDITIYGYPEDVFPPTDFHSATLIDHTIYLIGSLGYRGTGGGETPVFALDTRSFRIQRLHPSGSSPGWIYEHRATRRGEHEILIRGGRIHDDTLAKNPRSERSFVLDVRALRWREVVPG